MVEDFKKLCSPAKLYFVFAIISIVLGLFSGIHVVAVFFKLVFALLWTYVLNFICSKGYKTISWLLVLLPFFLIVLAFFGYMKMSQGQNILKMMQLQM